MSGDRASSIQFKKKVLKMRSQRLIVVCVVGLLLIAGGAQARRIERKRRGSHKFVPVYRTTDEQTTPTTVEEETERQLEPVQTKPLSNTKFLLLKRAAIAAAATANEEDSNAGRTFKHLLLYKNLLSPNGHGNGGGGGNGYLPYIIINTPTNLTNINNNTLTNAAAAAPTTPTGTGTGTGTRMGGIGGLGGGGFSYFKNPQQALPMAIPMPTQVYQQRETNAINDQLLPYNIVAMMGLNGFNGGLVPLALPAQLNTNQRRHAQPQRRRAPPTAPQNNRYNPFSAFANSFRGIPFF